MVSTKPSKQPHFVKVLYTVLSCRVTINIQFIILNTGTRKHSIATQDHHLGFKDKVYLIGLYLWMTIISYNCKIISFHR